ncbi:MAG: hypothetical protein IJX24_05065 [Oscillospiraceae bacterium]|nr:hypothetical protein [Oscillospiraceae bacterium]
MGNLKSFDMKIKKILAAAVSAVMVSGFLYAIPQTEIFEPLTAEGAFIARTLAKAKTK